MQNPLRRAAALGLCITLLLCCCGCMATGTDSLYSLPQMSDDYVQLQDLITARIDDGDEYAAPTSGSHRQTVQMCDLNGDGSNEAVAFLADSRHTPCICIYTRGEDTQFYLYLVIAGEGSAVSSVEYADVNGDGVTELLVCWQVGGDLRLLTVYSLVGDEPIQLLSTDCSEFLVEDLTGDGIDDVINLHIDYSNGCTVSCSSFTDGTASTVSASLSQGIGEIQRMRTGLLSDGKTGLFIESLWEDDYILDDIFTVLDGIMTNITLTADGYSSTVRASQAYATDINGDHALEIPAASGNVLNWYGIDSTGRRTLTLTTYHDYDDGWYLVLDDAMLTGLTVETGSVLAGSNYVIFSAQNADGSRSEWLAIYTLTGENRMERAALEGRFILAEQEATVYAAMLKTDLLNEQDIIAGFNIIYPEWQTGDL